MLTTQLAQLLDWLSAVPRRIGLAAGFIAETLARFEANPCGIYGVQIGMWTVFFYSEYLGFPVLLFFHQCFIPSHISFIQHRRYITLGNKSVVKPQYR
jgi:hypothetical protein